MSSTSRKGARQREFAGKDIESFIQENGQLKKKFAVVRQDNVVLRTQVAKLTQKLRKKEKQMDNVLSIKVNRVSDKDSDNHMSVQLQALKSEMMSISKLTQKVRDLELEVAEKDEELKLLKSSMKFTLIKELQIEAQTYFNEARRMKKLLDKGAHQPFRSSVHASNSSFRDIPQGGASELHMLRDEVQSLRRELTYLKKERGVEDQSYGVLQRLRSKMEGLQSEINSVQTHFHNVDGTRAEQGRLADMISAHDGLAEEIRQQELNLASGRNSQSSLHNHSPSNASSARRSRPSSAASHRPTSYSQQEVHAREEERDSARRAEVPAEPAREEVPSRPAAKEDDFTLAEELSLDGDDAAFDDDLEDYEFD